MEDLKDCSLEKIVEKIFFLGYDEGFDSCYKATEMSYGFTEGDSDNDENGDEHTYYLLLEEIKRRIKK